MAEVVAAAAAAVAVGGGGTAVVTSSWGAGRKYSVNTSRDIIG